MKVRSEVWAALVGTTKRSRSERANGKRGVIVVQESRVKLAVIVVTKSCRNGERLRAIRLVRSRLSLDFLPILLV